MGRPKRGGIDVSPEDEREALVTEARSPRFSGDARPALDAAKEAFESESDHFLRLPDKGKTMDELGFVGDVKGLINRAAYARKVQGRKDTVAKRREELGQARSDARKMDPYLKRGASPIMAAMLGGVVGSEEEGSERSSYLFELVSGGPAAAAAGARTRAGERTSTADRESRAAEAGLDRAAAGARTRASERTSTADRESRAAEAGLDRAAAVAGRKADHEFAIEMAELQEAKENARSQAEADAIDRRQKELMTQQEQQHKERMAQARSEDRMRSMMGLQESADMQGVPVEDVMKPYEERGMIDAPPQQGGSPTEAGPAAGPQEPRITRQMREMLAGETAKEQRHILIQKFGITDPDERVAILKELNPDLIDIQDWDPGGATLTGDFTKFQMPFGGWWNWALKGRPPELYRRLFRQ